MLNPLVSGKRWCHTKTAGWRHPRNFKLGGRKEKGGTAGRAFHALLAGHVTRLASGRRKIGIVLSREETMWRV